MDGMKLSTALGWLENDPLANIMLGHRELFHSNIIAWFIRFFPDAGNRVLEELTGGERHSSLPIVKRERLNTDLWVSWGDRAQVIVENKTFSLPNLGQLIDYAGKKGIDQEAHFIFLSVLDPKWPNNRFETEDGSWRYVSYRALSESIVAAMRGMPDSYEVETILRYARLIAVIAQFDEIASIHASNELVFFDEDLEGQLEGSNLRTTLHKLRSWHIKRHLESELARVSNKTYEIEAGLTRNKALNSWFIKRERDGVQFDWGWQLQGIDFRLALRLPTGRGFDEKFKRIEFAERNLDLFDFSYIDQHAELIDFPTMPKSGGFNHFEPDFIYRYKRCPDLTIAQLIQVTIDMASGHHL